MSKKQISRRQFVKTSMTSSALAATATTTLSACVNTTIKTDRQPSEYIGNWKIDESNKFDFIIVGSGAGGGPLAAGLAKAGFTVLVLEAGSDKKNKISETPVFHAKASEDPLLNWSYFVKSYSEGRYKAFERMNSKYQTDRQGIYYPRAAGLGGCTRVNALISLYPDQSDWSRLSKQLGDDPNYSPTAMFNVFKKMQNQNGGWLNISQANPATLLKEPFLIKMALAALSADGFDTKAALNEILTTNLNFKTSYDQLIEKFPKFAKQVADGIFDFVEIADGTILEGLKKLILEKSNFGLNPNHEPYISSTNKKNGVYNIPFNATNGIRQGVYEYLVNTERIYKNKLLIKTEALCTKIIFDPLDKTKAIGIEFIEGAHAYKADVLNEKLRKNSYERKVALARNEIILSGGAFNTPQLLMLSGVGPAQNRPLSIKPIADLNGVGKNLQDRYEVTVVSELNQPLSILKNCTFAKNNDFESDPCWKDYLKDPKGHLYGTNGVALSLIRRSHSGQPTPDLAIFGLPGFFKGYYPRYSTDTTPKNPKDKSYFTWAILKGHTKNHAGEVRLQSANPQDTPDINFKYFQDEDNGLVDDLYSVLQGLKVVRGINKKIGSKYFKEEVIPGNNVISDGDLSSWIMKEAWGHHASCTSKMGLSNDPMAVVDNRFKVHGFKNLRIVDASVFPDIPGLFIMLPTLIMSERAKELILEDHGITT